MKPGPDLFFLDVLCLSFLFDLILFFFSYLFITHALHIQSILCVYIYIELGLDCFWMLDKRKQKDMAKDVE